MTNGEYKEAVNRDNPEMKEKKPILEIRELSIEFHDSQVPETVVHDLNLTAGEGEILGIVGESGSGKSMTALAIAGLLRRHDLEKRGKILFDGVDLLTCERSRLRQYQGKEIGIVFQEPMTSLDPLQKIGRQVEESLRIHTGLKKAERKKRAIAALHQVELADAERIYGMYPHELSGGMRQRAMIAAAMICGPRLLIADEPTTALDVTVQAQIVELLKKINRENNTTILFISHDLSLVRRLCERVVVMQGGYIVETGTAEELFRFPQEEYTRRLIAAIPECIKRKGGNGE